MIFGSEEDIAGQVVDREHNPFTKAGSAGSVVQNGHCVVIQIRILDVVDGEAVGVSFAVMVVDVALVFAQCVTMAFIQAAVVGERKDGFDAFDLIAFDGVPVDVADEKELRARMVNDVMDIVGVEILEDRYDHGAIGNGGDEQNAPSRIIATDQGNAIALFETGFFEEQVEFGDLFGHFEIGKIFLFEIVGQGRQFAVVAEAGFI